jgi:hypothetical protein
MTTYEKLFGTAERAAETIGDICQGIGSCSGCPLYELFPGWCDEGMDLEEVLEGQWKAQMR